MKYKIEETRNDTAFKPFSLTLTFETKEEYENFHNKAMGKITGVSSHEFHRDIYLAGNGEQMESAGSILKPLEITND